MGASRKYNFKVASEYIMCYGLFWNRRIYTGEPFINSLDHHRNHKHHIRLEYSHVFYHMKKRIINTYRRAQRKSFEPVHYQTISMMDRKHTEQYTSGLCRVRNGNHVRCQVVLCQHNSFAFSCRSGCKNNGCYIVWGRSV